MGTIGPILTASANLGLLYAQRLLNDVTPDIFARLPRPGGQLVQTNHPAFIFGHLSIYPVRVLTQLGRPAEVTEVPEHYTALFKPGVECQDDPDARIYPPMAELTARFFSSYQAAVSAVDAADDAALLQPNPAEGRMRELFPTLGAAFAFYLGGHIQNHLGQFSAWRRAMGLKPA